jgi:hypothetical protein
MRASLLFALMVVPGTAIASDAPRSEKPFKMAMYCLKSGEQVSGMNKICFYNCAGSEAAITIKSFELCPLSIDH